MPASSDGNERSEVRAVMEMASYDGLRVFVLGAALLAVLALEWRVPNAALRRPWRTNLGLWLVDTVLMRVVCGACGLAVAAWADARDVGVLQQFELPPWVMVAFAIVALDGVSWLWHRANHRAGWLWRWHRIHHADRAFQVTTALRFHPGELLLALPVRLAAIAALGITPPGVIAFELCFGVMNLLVHGNFDLPSRFDRAAARLLVTPSLHRLHHARSAVLMNTNYGTVFSVFDRVFGTLHPGVPGAQLETGTVDAGQQMSLQVALLAPFSGRAEDR